MLSSRGFWSLCLLLAVGLFLASLIKQNLWLLLATGCLATVIYFMGDDILFAEYNKRREAKRERLQKVFDDRRKKQ